MNACYFELLSTEGRMKTVTIRNIPENIYHVISLLAERNRRSLQQQILFLLERAQSMNVEPPVVKAANIRKRLQGRPLGDTVKDIREERDR